MPIDLQNIIANIPNKPGCYQFLDKNNVVIYVGKAKNLKRRVTSYFNKNHRGDIKTSILVGKINDIKYIVVDTEEDTLLLENNLIKELQPRYNVLLRDDKTYASIVITNERFPRVMQTRNILKDGSSYFGPYASVYAIKVMLDALFKVFLIRTCSLNLSEESIKEKKHKVCLDYHIDRCLGPCEGLQSEEDYNESIEAIKKILNGDTKIVSKDIYEKMLSRAKEEKFEEANKLKIKFEAIESFREKATVVSNINYNIDVYSFDENEQSAYINYLNVRNGAIIQAYTFEYKKKLEENKEELLALGIIEMRERFKSSSKEIVVPFMPELELKNIKFTIPQRGDKVKLLDLSTKNVKQYKLDKLKRAESLNPEQRSTRRLKILQNDLQLKELPRHIECFDNSNFHGTNAVSACVVFKMTKPSKKDYRHFNVKTVEGSDDYATMREVLTRRYRKLIEENLDLPQLIVIDGGKGQLSIAMEVLKELNIYGKTAIISIAEKLEEIYYPEDSVPLYLDKNSESLKIIQHLRDEAHRFGLNHHRKKRSKEQVKSELDNIKGIGLKSKTNLLKKFKSVKRIKEADLKELSELIGENRAKIILEYFKTK